MWDGGDNIFFAPASKWLSYATGCDSVQRKEREREREHFLSKAAAIVPFREKATVLFLQAIRLRTP